MTGSAFLTIDATKTDSATLEADYALRHRPSGTLLIFTETSPGSKIYNSNFFSIVTSTGPVDIYIDVEPVADKILEGTETIDANLRTSPRYSGDTGDHGTATANITETYYDASKEADASPDPESKCNCPCSCATDIEVQPRDGAASVKSSDGAVTYVSEGQDSQRPDLRVKLTVPAGKAIPETLELSVDVITPNFNAANQPIGLGRTVGARVFASVSVTGTATQFTTEAGGARVAWFSISPDLTAAIDT